MENIDDHWKINKKWPKRVFWLLVVLLIIYLLVMPFLCDYRDRSRASGVIIAVDDAKREITKFIEENPRRVVALDAKKLIPETISVRSKSGEVIEIAFREISQAGEIKIFTPQLGLMLIFTPEIKNGKVNWSCWGRPLDLVSSMCQGSL